MDHIYMGERCIFCNSNSLDVMLYNVDETCLAHDEPFVYSTSSGDSGPTDPRFDRRF